VLLARGGDACGASSTRRRCRSPALGALPVASRIAISKKTGGARKLGISGEGSAFE